jgi:hypothetical protein
MADLGIDAGSFTTGGSAASELATKQHANTGTPINFRSVFIPAPPRDVGRLYRIMLSVEGVFVKINAQGESIDQLPENRSNPGRVPSINNSSAKPPFHPDNAGCLHGVYSPCGLLFKKP